MSRDRGSFPAVESSGADGLQASAVNDFWESPENVARFAAREFVARFARETGTEPSAVVTDRMLFAFEIGYLRGHGEGMRAAGQMLDVLATKESAP